MFYINLQGCVTMKNFKQLVGVLAISAIAPAAFAHMDHFNEPYVGVDVTQTNQSFKNGHGKFEFKKNPLDASVFAGFKFSHYFGVEAGWDQQFKKSKTVAVNHSEDIEDEFGNPENFSGTSNVKYEVKGTHPYLGLFGEYKYHAWRFQALLGASFSKVKIKYTVISETGVVPADLATGVTESDSKSKVVPMVKLAAMYKFTENFGARVHASYRNTSAIKFKVGDAGGQAKLRDTFGLGLGVVYTFG